MLRRSPVVSVSLATALSLASCADRESFPDLSFVVFDAQANNPLNGRMLTSARAYFETGMDGVGEDYTESPVEDGTFDVVVPIDDVSRPMKVRLELSSEAGVELIGGTPYYFPAQASRVGIVVGEPGSCDALAGLAIGTARSSFGVSEAGVYVLLSGGLGDAGTTPLVDVDTIELLGFTQYHLTNAPAALGATKAAAVDTTASLVVPSLAAPYVHQVYATSAATSRPAIALHDGAARADAVLHVEGTGAIVVGGGEDATPSAEASWVLRDSSTGSYLSVKQTLHAAEPDRVAAASDVGVWVVSRGVGDTTLEQLAGPTTAPVVRIAAISDGVRNGGLLVASASGTDLLLLGGVDQNGDVRTDTVAIAGCPDACVAGPGPTWNHARIRFATDGSGIVVGGIEAGVPSALVQRVRRGSTQWVIDDVATLTTARSDAGVIRMPTGPIYVFGGIDASASRRDVEICFVAP